MIVVADGRSAQLMNALSSWRRAYWLNILKSDPSVVLRMGFVMWDPTITVISSVIASLTLIAAMRVVFCLSALSWASALVMISIATTQSVVLAAVALENYCFLTLLFLIATLILYVVSVFGILMPSPTMSSAYPANT